MEQKTMVEDETENKIGDCDKREDHVGDDDTGELVEARAERRAGLWYKVTKTVFMVIAPATMGIYLELSGPTLPDLMDRTDSNYEQISQALVSRSVGYLVGSLCAGLLASYFPAHMELLLGAALVIGSVGTLLTPWCYVLWLLAIMFLIQGLGQGMIDTSNNTLCMHMWKDKATAPIHALHFGFGIGAFIAPQLARPFLISRDNTTTNTTNDNSTSSELSAIEIPYTISFALTFIWGVIFLIFYIIERISDRKKPRDQADEKNGEDDESETKACDVSIISPGSCTYGDVKFGLLFFILVFFFYLNIVGGERAYGKFIYSYATDGDPEFSVDDATFLNSLFWICFTAGRGVAILVSSFLRPSILLTVELAMNIISGVVLSIWGNSVPGVLWAFTGILGFFLAPIFPSGMAFANRYVAFNGAAVAVVFVGSSAGGVVYQYMTGYLFEYYGPNALMYVMAAYAVVLTAVFILQLLLVRHRPVRGEREDVLPDKSDILVVDLSYRGLEDQEKTSNTSL